MYKVNDYLIYGKDVCQVEKIEEKDKPYFELAEEYLYNEFSITLNKSYEETKEYIINAVAKLETK